jgi:hypothetical protein
VSSDRSAQRDVRPCPAGEPNWAGTPAQLWEQQATCGVKGCEGVPLVSVKSRALAGSPGWARATVLYYPGEEDSLTGAYEPDARANESVGIIRSLTCDSGSYVFLFHAGVTT